MSPASSAPAGPAPCTIFLAKASQPSWASSAFTLRKPRPSLKDCHDAPCTSPKGHRAGPAAASCCNEQGFSFSFRWSSWEALWGQEAAEVWLGHRTAGWAAWGTQVTCLSQLTHCALRSCPSSVPETRFWFRWTVAGNISVWPGGLWEHDLEWVA